MRTLKRNQTEFWYANPIGTEPILDENGYETGEMQVLYGEPVSASGNISPARGAAELDMFGIHTNYTKTIVPDCKDIPIGKYTILWLDDEPDDAGEAGAVKHDYVFAAVAKSINSVTIAVKEVNVS